ncbi:dienelactone hydrolase family protein [Modestobacter sp. VKM Ac-2985]|uniref:dienelactone hydrolase family protein n=1 Tax=Modestobacter sp. VKM Ac-2985 TaxID=3004139 RepID=UPI0022AB722F|nr:dienelactone hydrolase family protein [Modestobacter sp. VKM Ac-2985]MCZ2839882.1 dienelactone hydrolase family protein [Modestobacter sp. VKM Ac-2985]
MTSIALFHSALGVRPGISDAAERLRAAGHQVSVVDQYDGLVFDDYATGSAHTDQIGFPALMQAALDGVAELPDGFVAAGFSNGAGMAEYVATRRRCAGLLLFSGALPLDVLGAAWPTGLPVQIHYSLDDPFRRQEWIDAVASDATRGGGRVETFDYPGTGHLFTDPSLPTEYDPAATELLWQRALAFLHDLTD